VLPPFSCLLHLTTYTTPTPPPPCLTQVHRGAYEAALALYDRFLPLVQEAVDACPFGRVCFTVRTGCVGVGWLAGGGRVWFCRSSPCTPRNSVSYVLY
jgi:hypothetical protein